MHDMQNRRHLLIICGAALLAGAVWAAITGAYTPGRKTLVLSHPYPDHGKYTDRLDRAIATLVPFATEQDLAWVDGKSLMIHGAKNVADDDPTLDCYFIPGVRPLIEKALQEGNKGNCRLSSCTWTSRTIRRSIWKQFRSGSTNTIPGSPRL